MNKEQIIEVYKLNNITKTVDELLQIWKNGFTMSKEMIIEEYPYAEEVFTVLDSLNYPYLGNPDIEFKEMIKCK